MYKNIMVALDGSSHGRVAIEQALILAKRLNGRLHGVHVLDTSILRGSILHDVSGSLGLEPQLHLTSRVEGFMREIADNLFRAFEERCQAEGVQCRTTLTSGEIAEALAEAADLEDVVVMGKRGSAFDTDSRRSGGHGSVRRMMKLSATPMLSSGLDASPLRNPLVAYDGTPGAHRAIIDAVRLATCLEVPFKVCHIGLGAGSEGADPLDEARRYVAPYPVDAEFVALEGDPMDTLSSFVRRHGHDLVMAGYHGSGWLKEAFSRRAPDVLLHRVPCPLWISK